MKVRENVHFEANPPGTEADAAVVRVVTNIAELPADAWNALAGDSPFVRHAFLHALEATGCVGAPIGWEPV
ncbi:MAG: peptidogalycan biosysnthesis protein, partial [Gammaproteobacteria bacterium]